MFLFKHFVLGNMSVMKWLQRAGKAQAFFLSRFILCCNNSLWALKILGIFKQLYTFFIDITEQSDFYWTTGYGIRTKIKATATIKTELQRAKKINTNYNL